LCDIFAELNKLNISMQGPDRWFGTLNAWRIR